MLFYIYGLGIYASLKCIIVLAQNLSCRLFAAKHLPETLEPLA